MFGRVTNESVRVSLFTKREHQGILHREDMTHAEQPFDSFYYGQKVRLFVKSIDHASHTYGCPPTAVLTCRTPVNQLDTGETFVGTITAFKRYGGLGQRRIHSIGVDIGAEKHGVLRRRHTLKDHCKVRVCASV